MNKLIPRALTFVILLCSLVNHAQDTIVTSYLFNYSQNFYYEFNDGDDSDLPADWLDESSDLAVIFPFDFKVFNKSIVGLTSYYKPSLLYFVLEEGEESTDLPFLVPFGKPDLQNRINAELNEEMSDISKIVVGETGNRILKIQYRNVGFQQDIITDQFSSDFVNFQLWFYEATHAIEIHYGTYDVPNAEISFEGASGPTFGIFEVNEDYILNGSGEPSIAYFLENDPNNPELLEVTDNMEEHDLNNMPPVGMSYTLTPIIDTLFEVSSNKNIWLEGVNVFPNPTTDLLQIEVKESELQNASYFLTTTSGQLVSSGLLTNDTHTIDLSKLESGLYYLKIQKGKYGVIKKLMVE